MDDFNDDSFKQGMQDVDGQQPHQPMKSAEKPTKKKWILIGIILLIAILVLGYMFFFRKDADAPAESTQTETSEEEKTRIRLIATGDFIPHDAINLAAEQEDGSYDYSPMYGDMKELFDESDINFCNQAVLGGGTEFEITGYPKFNSPTEFADDMAGLGCNVINTGTNHTNDFGQEVIDASVDTWQGQPGVKAVAGANKSEQARDEVKYFEVKGVKFAFVSYTTYTNEPSPNSYSVTMYDANLAKTQLTEARDKADIVIASMRWGTEYSSEINELQKSTAQEVANFGADIILGHGPHVLQPVEQITLDDGRVATVWYSLGNFINSQLEPETLFNVIGVMDINPDTKKVDTIGYMPIYMHYEWTAEEKAADDLLARKNFELVLVDDANELFERSQSETTLADQESRIQETVTKLLEVKRLSKDEYLQS